MPRQLLNVSSRGANFMFCFSTKTSYWSFHFLANKDVLHV